DQRRLPLGRPSFDVLVHRHAHRYLLPCSMSRFSMGQYTSGEGKTLAVSQFVQQSRVMPAGKGAVMPRA
ncbi:MAG: hypothetical protein ACO3U4_08345, partial [Gemmobacter sp.]